MSRSRDGREFALAFHEVLRRYQFQDVERVCEYGITISECHALELIALNGPLSVNEVATGLRVNKSTEHRAGGKEGTDMASFSVSCMPKGKPGSGKKDAAAADTPELVIPAAERAEFGEPAEMPFPD